MGNNYDKEYVKIDNVYVDKQILKTFFCCDLSRCKGFCCVIKGTLGPPVSQEEVELIEKIIPVILEYFEKPKLEYLYSNGFYDNFGGNLYLKTLYGDDCIFSYYESDIAKCIFQKAFSERKIDFKKPISCDLFPIRIYRGENTSLRYEKIETCNSAVEKGNKEKTRLVDFVSEALERVFGMEFVNQIKK
ncbi:MAG: DUF3109 family protein [Ignavibacteria bacterium]|nr:DUF3109 family protein [Ignavibacteria bacterium]